MRVSEHFKRHRFLQDPYSDRYKAAYDRPEVGPSIYAVNEEFIKKEAKKHENVSWALMKHPSGLLCEGFASHAWVEGVFEFVTRLRQSWPHGLKGMFICFLSHPQVGAASLSDNIPLKESPFYLAMLSAKHVIILPNQHQSIYSRLWCTYEAYCAVQRAEETDISIEVGYGMPKNFLIAETLFGLVLAVGGMILTNRFLAPVIARYLGPLTWLLLAFILSHVLSILARSVLKAAIEHRPSQEESGSESLSGRWHYRLQIVLVYLEILIWAVAGGCALFILWGAFEIRSGESGTDLTLQLRNSEEFPDKEDLAKYRVTIFYHAWFEVGEEVACLFLACGMFAVFFQHIFVVLLRKVILHESHMMNFSCVANAETLNKDDKQKILSEIGQEHKRVDEIVNMLRSIGRYNAGIHKNISRGLGYKTARDFWSMPGKAVAAVLSWQFWWVADLAGHDMLTMAIAMLVVSGIIALIAVAALGDRCIFAVEVFFWLGLTFVILSNWMLLLLRSWVVEMKMSFPTAVLQVLLFMTAAVLCSLFYTGRLKAVFVKFHNIKGQCRRGSYRMVRRQPGTNAPDYNEVPVDAETADDFVGSPTASRARRSLLSS